MKYSKEQRVFAEAQKQADRCGVEFGVWNITSDIHDKNKYRYVFRPLTDPPKYYYPTKNSSGVFFIDSVYPTGSMKRTGEKLKGTNHEKNQ
jgi:hypothetical protein